MKFEICVCDVSRVEYTWILPHLVDGHQNHQKLRMVNFTAQNDGYEQHQSTLNLIFPLKKQLVLVSSIKQKASVQKTFLIVNLSN